MKPARFHPEAEVELAAEAKFYEEQWRGLGERFTEEVEAALKLASLFPEIGSPYKYGTRRVFPKKFPFSIVYTVLVKELVVLAIAPFPHKVAYWRNRKSAG